MSPDQRNAPQSKVSPEQPFAHGFRHGARARVRAGLGVDAREVGLDGALADAALRGDRVGCGCRARGTRALPARAA